MGVIRDPDPSTETQGGPILQGLCVSITGSTMFAPTFTMDLPSGP